MWCNWVGDVEDVDVVEVFFVDIFKYVLVIIIDMIVCILD